MNKRFLKSAAALVLSVLMMGTAINPVVLAETAYLATEPGEDQPSNTEIITVTEEPAELQEDGDEAESSEDASVNENNEEGEEAGSEEITTPEETTEEAAPAAPAESAEPEAEEEPAEEAEVEETAGETAEKAEEAAAESSTADSAVNQEEENEPEYPVFAQTGTVGNVAISVSAGEGVFPAGSVLAVRHVVSAREIAAVDEVIGEFDPNTDTTYYFDIKVLGPDGNEIQPAEGQAVSISFQLDKAADQNLDAEVIHVRESGQAEVLNAVNVGNTLNVTSDGFSVYALNFKYIDGNRTIYTREIKTGVGRLLLSDVFTLGGVTPMPDAETEVESIATSKDIITAGFVDNENPTFGTGYLNVKEEFDSDTNTTVTVTVKLKDDETEYEFVFVSSEENIFDRVTIHFDSNGGDAGQSMPDLPFVNVILPQQLSENTFTRECYAFKEWNTKADGTGEPFTAGNYYWFNTIRSEVSEDSTVLTLYAIWELANYTVVYSANNGSGNMPSQQATYMQEFELAENKFERRNYNFMGWNTAADGSGKDYKDKDSIVIDSELPNNRLRLYAQWAGVNNATIRFDKNSVEATGTMGNQPIIMDYAILYSLDENEFKWEGHNFLGWSRYPDATEPTYQNGARANTVLTGDDRGEIVTLYAVWEVNTEYTVVFNPNYTTLRQPYTQKFTYGEPGKLTDNQFNRSGYKFNGWNTSQDGDGTSYKNEDDVQFKKGELTNDRLMLYAQWVGDNYVTIRFDKNSEEATGTMRNQSINLSLLNWLSLNEREFTRQGYNFLGWSKDPKAVDKEFDDGASASEVVRATDAGTIVTLYAVWEEKTAYTVEFNPNFTTLQRPYEQDIPYGKEESLENNRFSRTSYTFNGWNTASNGSGISYDNLEKVQFEKGELTNDTLRLYAQWVNNNYCVIRFDKNADDAIGTMNNQNVYVDWISYYSLNDCGFTRTGYEFIGWALSSEATDPVYDNMEDIANITVASEGVLITLYAVWKSNEFTVTLGEGGDTFLERYDNGFFDEDQEIDSVDVSEYTAAFTDQFHQEKKVYFLDGYYDDSNKVIDPEGNIVVPNTYFTEDKTLTIKKKPETKINVEDPTKSGMAFGGWYGSDGVVYQNGDNVDYLTVSEFTAIWYQFADGTVEWTTGSSSAARLRFITVSPATDIIKGRFDLGGKVFFDGTLMSAGSYTAERGSLVISINRDFLAKQSLGTHTVTVEFDNVSLSGTLRIANPSAVVDNVVTCQMAGYPENYAWNEAAKACQPGFIDGAGNFHPENTYRRYKAVPNTSDNGNTTFWMLALLTMTITSFVIVKILHEDWQA